MIRIRHILKSNSGQGYPLVIAITLCLILIFSGVAEYFRVMIVVQGVRDTLQDAVISTVTENYADVYHGTREGYAGGYSPTDMEFQESLNYGDIYKKLEEALALEYANGVYEKRTKEHKLEYTIADLNVVIKNAPFQGSGNPKESFQVDSYITLEVPMSFAGESLPNIRMNLKTSGGYSPKF